MDSLKPSYLIIIYIFLPPYSISKFFPLVVYLGLLVYEICSKYPSYAFIWPYSFNWRLGVRYKIQLHKYFTPVLNEDRRSTKGESVHSVLFENARDIHNSRKKLKMGKGSGEIYWGKCINIVY